MKNSVIWTRVSTKRQEDNGGSLDDQKCKCEVFARQNGYNVKGYFGGTHESAKTPGPLLKEMYNAIKKDRTITHIIVSVVDRFSRNVGQASTIIDELLKQKVIIVEAATGIDTSTREGVMMIKFKLTLAEWDNGNRTDKFTSGRKHCLESGVYCGAAKPLGYDKHGKSMGTTFTVNDQGRLIAKAFRWKLQGLANHQILSRLSIYGLDMSKQKLHKILTNPFYAGKIKHKMLDGKLVDGNQPKIVSYEDCMIQDITANRIMKTVKKLMLKYNIVPFNEDSELGLLRHVFVRVGKHSKQVLVALVTASEIFPGRKDFVKDLRKEHPEITTVIQSVNDTTTSMVLGDKERVLFGDGYIVDTLCGLKFQISATSFYQVNPIQTEHLYSKAIEFANLKSTDVVLDAYSGIGTIGLIASTRCREVISVELNKQAFKDAIKNAKLNGIKNTYFYNADATEFIQVMADEKAHLDVLLMDPPRSGSTEEFLYSVSKLQPRKIVYVSCNVETQVRDLKYLLRAGYQIKKVQPVDMFPSTKHVECVVGLQLKNT